MPNFIVSDARRPTFFNPAKYEAHKKNTELHKEAYAALLASRQKKAYAALLATRQNDPNCPNQPNLASKLNTSKESWFNVCHTRAFKMLVVESAHYALNTFPALQNGDLESRKRYLNKIKLLLSDIDILLAYNNVEHLKAELSKIHIFDDFIHDAIDTSRLMSPYMRQNIYFKLMKDLLDKKVDEIYNLQLNPVEQMTQIQNLYERMQNRLNCELQKLLPREAVPLHSPQPGC